MQSLQPAHAQIYSQANMSSRWWQEEHIAWSKLIQHPWTRAKHLIWNHTNISPTAAHKRVLRRTKIIAARNQTSHFWTKITSQCASACNEEDWIVPSELDKHLWTDTKHPIWVDTGIGQTILQKSTLLHQLAIHTASNYFAELLESTGRASNQFAELWKQIGKATN